MVKSKRRRSPYNEPELFNKWKTIHKYNTKELGMSIRQSYIEISNQYSCSLSCCSYWLDENVKTRTLKHQKKVRIRYQDRPIDTIEDRKRYSRIFMDIRRFPNQYLLEIYQNNNQPKSLEKMFQK